MSIPAQSETLNELIKIAKDWKKKPCTHQFNLIDELHANENAHTRILVRMLQIPALLRSFLEYIKENFPEQATFVIPEELSSNDVSEFSDYIDAKIETEKFCIIIENKINYAVDQDRQIERYVNTVRSRNKNIFVLYLTLNGMKKPSLNSIGDSEALIIEVNYHHILDWLEHKITFSVSDTLQQPFLQSGILQYIDYIKGRLGMRENNCDALFKGINDCLAKTKSDIFDVIAELQYLRAYWRIYFTRNIPNSWDQLPDELKTEILFDLCGQFFAIAKTTDNRNCFLYEGEIFSLEAVTASKISLMQIDIHYSGNKNGIESYKNKIEEIKPNLLHYMEFEYNGASCLRVAINAATELESLFKLLSLDAEYNFNFIEKEDISNDVKDYSILGELEKILTVLGNQRESNNVGKSLNVENGQITESYSYNNGRAIQLTQKAWKQPESIDIWSKDNGEFIIKLIQSLNKKNEIYPYSCRWWNGKFYLHFPLLSFDDEYNKKLSQMLYDIYQNEFESK